MEFCPVRVQLALACQEREAARQGPEPIPFPTERYNPDDRFELTPKGLAYRDSTDPDPDPDPPIPEPMGAGDHVRGALTLDGICPSCGALGRVVQGGHRVGCEYCFG